MATIVITGASGLLGGHLLGAAAAGRHTIRALSRSGSPKGTPADARPNLTWMRADLTTGDGIDAALAGAEGVIHAASAPAGDTQRTDVDGTRVLAEAARRAGIRHLLYVSIVGVDRIPVAYYRHKLAAEQLVRASGVPWTIVRGTQFHEFMDRFTTRLTRFPIAIVPAGFKVQPMDPREFADAVWRAVEAGPAQGIVEAGGPAVLSWRELVSRWMAAQGIRKPMLPLPLPGKAAAALRRGDGTTPTHAIGSTTWDAWLRRRYGSLAESPSRGTS